MHTEIHTKHYIYTYSQPLLGMAISHPQKPFQPGVKLKLNRFQMELWFIYIHPSPAAQPGRIPCSPLNDHNFVPVSLNSSRTIIVLWTVVVMVVAIAIKRFPGSRCWINVLPMMVFVFFAIALCNFLFQVGKPFRAANTLGPIAS